MELIKTIIFAAILLKASVSDIRTRTVADELSVMIIITGLISVELSDIFNMIISALIVPLPLLIAAIIKPGRMGGADIKIMSAIAFMLGITRGISALMLGLLLGIVCTIIIQIFTKVKHKKAESFPLVAYLSIAGFLQYLL